MVLLFFLALLGFQSMAVQADGYEALSWFTTRILAGHIGTLGQSVRIPHDFFAESICQLVYLPSPDWATSKAYVDFGSSSQMTGCKRQAFLVYIDGYNTPTKITGISSKKDVPWAGLATFPANIRSATYGSTSPSPTYSPGTSPWSSLGSPPAPPPTIVIVPSPPPRQWWTSAIDIPLDRERFASPLDNVRDSAPGMNYVLNSEAAAKEVLPGANGLLSRPILASGYLQSSSAIPADPAPYLDHMLQKAAQAAQGAPPPSPGASDSSDDYEQADIAGLLSGPLPVYALLPQECRDVLSSRQKTSITVSTGHSIYGSSSSSLGHSGNLPSSRSHDLCFVTQMAVLVYNDCPAAARAANDTTTATNSYPKAPESSFGFIEDRYTVNGSSFPSDIDAKIAQQLRDEVLKQSAEMIYTESYEDVQITVLYKPYDGCYRGSAQRLGQSGLQLILFSAGLIVLLTLVLLLPTFFRMFIGFPMRATIYGIRKLIRRGKVLNELPLDAGLHSYKQPSHHRFFKLPGVRHLLGARSHLLHAMCTVNSADGQYRGLQVSVMSSVALMICMMSFPPHFIPPMEFFMPPLNFKIDRTSDPLSYVWYFLTILAFSLYLGFIGYLAMLSNYNKPTSRYYLTQCIMSVFFMLLLDTLIIMQVVSILVYWEDLDPKWPWLPIITFQLANLVVSNVLLIATLFARESRRIARRRIEYLCLMEELARREERLARIRHRPDRRQGQEGSAVEVDGFISPSAPEVDGTVISASSSGISDSVAGGLVGGQLRHRASNQDQQQQQQQHPKLPHNNRVNGDFDSLAMLEGGPRAGGRPMAEGVEEKGWGGGAATSDTGELVTAVAVAGRAAVEGGSPASSSSSSRSHHGSHRFQGTESSHIKSLKRRWAKQQGAGGLSATWRKWMHPLSEDAAFRFPAWLIAALLVSAYMLIFTFARAMTWVSAVEHCIADPAECINNNVSRYLLFATRLLGRDWQVQMRDSLDVLASSQGNLEEILQGNTTIPGLNYTLDTATDDLTSALRKEASTQVEAALAAELPTLLNTTLGPELASRIPQRERDAFQSQLSALVESRLSQMDLRSTVTEPFTRSIMGAFNGSFSGLLTAITATSKILTVSITVSKQLDEWKKDLEVRFFWCSLAGFLLGLLLGLSSLLRTAIAFRIAARKLRLARSAGLVLSTSYDSDKGPAGAASDRDEHGGKWAVSNMRNVFDEEDSIVKRSAATNISLVVFFFGVLLSTAIVQLYVVGVTLSVGLAVASHPWTWTWMLPRYYMWLVAIIIGLVLQKVFLVSFVGDTWLSNGDHIHRPAAWLAFLVIASATNLIVGLLLAVYRIVLLLATTIFTLGKLDVTLFTILAKLDLPHTTFLAGLHLQESMSNFHDPIYLPGPTGRAHRRWRKLREALKKCGIEKLRQIVEAVPYPENHWGGNGDGGDGGMSSFFASSPRSGATPTPLPYDQVMVVVPHSSELELTGTASSHASGPPDNEGQQPRSPAVSSPTVAQSPSHAHRRRLPPFLPP